MMLLVASILTCQFFPTYLRPSTADQAGLASVYSHESGSGTASGQKLNREALTAAHVRLRSGARGRVRTSGIGRSASGPSTNLVPSFRGPVLMLTRPRRRPSASPGFPP